jgi:2-polyprenyl-6-methoxyphenol hydroxylase-like FAD-dependent oxidoreductase
MSRSTHDAIVIGAGPAGSSAALALARRGWRVAIVEKARFPRRKVCGEYVSAAAWPVLRALGVADELEPRAGPAVRRVGLFAAHTVVDVAMPRAGLDWGRALGRESLDAALLEHARRAGAEVLQPWTVIEARVSDEAAHLVVRSGDRERELRAPLAIAAHGSWEHGPLPTQREREPHAPGDLLAFKARFVGARLAAGLMPLVLFPGGYGGLVESDAGRVTFSCCVRRDALLRLRAAQPGANAGEAVLAHVLACSRGVRSALGGAWREGAWLAAGPIRPGIRVRAPARVFAVGNAAGEAHPLVAEGIGMAIQSAWLLGEALDEAGDRRDGAALAGAARDYERRWRSQFAARVRASSLFAHATRRAPGACVALLGAAPAMLAWGARASGKSAPLPMADRP